jgi:glycosyltransferase involved in cell wall biosynthesis
MIDENILTWAKPWIQLLSFLQNSDIENEVVCRPGGDLGQKLTESKIPVHYYRPPFSNSPWFSRGLGTLIKDIEPDIIHTRLSSAALQGGFWGKKYHIPVISTVDKYAKLKYYRKADHVVAVSQHLKEWLCKRGLPLPKTDVIYNPLDTGYYRRDLSIRDKTRKENNLTDQETVVIGAGRFVKWKGFDLLIDVVSSMNQRGKVKLWLAGDGPEMPVLRAKVEELELEDVVTFWGFVQDIRPLLWAADIFVLPSKEPEPFGLVLLEAMASGLPVVATSSGGPLDMVTADTGWLVALDNPSSMLSALEQAFNERSLSQMGHNAMERACLFDISEIGFQYIRLYNDILSSAKG